MTPEKLDEARAKETLRRLVDSGKVYCHEDIAALGARLARENWTPPKPVDPDLLAFREFASKAARSASLAESYRDGDMDSCASAHLFLAGARMAREQERERAKVLVEFAVALETFGLDDSISAIPRGAREALAKYRGEA